MLSLLRPSTCSSIPRYIVHSMRYASVASKSKKPSPGLKKIQALQAKFQEDNGKPIFLKGGTLDNVLYRSTWALCFIGLLLNIKLYVGYILF